MKEFYRECSNRGFCKVISEEGKDFLTLFSSDTNFTHYQRIFAKFPEKVWVSPRLSRKNMDKLERLQTELDSSRLTSIIMRRNRIIVEIRDIYGELVTRERMKLYTIKCFSKFNPNDWRDRNKVVII